LRHEIRTTQQPLEITRRLFHEPLEITRRLFRALERVEPLAQLTRDRHPPGRADAAHELRDRGRLRRRLALLALAETAPRADRAIDRG
jgi:hypothetical protein